MKENRVTQTQVALLFENVVYRWLFAVGISRFTERANREQAVVADVVSARSEIGWVVKECYSITFAFDRTCVVNPSRSKANVME